MIIHVERCWNGHRTIFKLKMPNGGHEMVVREDWDRIAVSEALDVAENVYGLKRSNVRFKHK